jgi:putative transposase
VISLDPGVRTFMTGYDKDGKTFEFGKGGMKRIEQHLHRADGLNSKIYKRKADVYEHNHKRRQNMKKAMRKILSRVTNKINDCHHKVSKYLCENYDAVLLPIFNTQEMIGKGSRKINSRTARQMCTWSHYKFRQIINAKAKRYGCLIVPCDEYLTSKTCSHCGNVNWDLKGEKEYICERCDQVLDRDINAAKNILMKFLCE